MKAGEIRAAIASPIGMPPLREFAKSKKEVVILFDDLTRSTRVYEIVPFILKELAQAGITEDRIRFIAAVANHQAMDRVSLAKKLGEDIVAMFPVYNHCPFLNCTYIGTTSFGTKAYINSEVMHCDLKIGIGQIVPHPLYGLGGGGKIVIPGVASYDTVVAHHGQTHTTWMAERRKLGLPVTGVIDSPINADAQEIARMVGLDMLINCIVNLWGETAAIFAGALEPTYQAAVEEAKSHYITINTRDNDIVIANAYNKAAEFNMAMSNAVPAVNPRGGDIVLIANSPSGQDVHYLFDSFGKTISGSLGRPMMLAPHINRLIFYTEYPEAKLRDRFADRDKVLLMSDWKQVVKTLEKSYGVGTKVAVYPSADIQYFAD
jgi:nickel-dependent lactate racemase